MPTIQLALTFDIPPACGNEQTERRRAHADLATMPPTELETEAMRCRFALAFGNLATPWQRTWTAERLTRCNAEVAHRRRERGHE